MTSHQALSGWGFSARDRDNNTAPTRNGAKYHEQVQKNQMHWKLVRTRPKGEDHNNN